MRIRMRMREGVFVFGLVLFSLLGFTLLSFTEVHLCFGSIYLYLY